MRITLKVVLEHMQAMRNELVQKIDGTEKRLSKRIDGVQADMTNFKKNAASNFERIERKLDNNSDAIHHLHLTIVEQQHEKRIRRLEKVAGFVK
jgi:hypothetical protein